MENDYKKICENISASYDVGVAKQYGIPSAVLLNKLIYLSKYTARGDNFCWRTSKELEDELGLTRKQQDLAITKLVNAGIIEVKNTYITGTQTKCRHFKVNNCCISDSNKRDISDLYERDKSVNNNININNKNINNIISSSINNNNNNNIYNNICDLVENEFGRPLSQLECEQILQWEDNELTRYAIKLAVLNNKRSIRYIDKIIYNYKKSNIKSVSEAQQQEEEYHNKIEEQKRNRDNYYKSKTKTIDELLDDSLLED